MIAAPASTQRFASAAISSGVMGTLGLVALVWFSLTATSMISFSMGLSFAGSWHGLATGLSAPYPHQDGRNEEPAPEQYTARAPALRCARLLSSTGRRAERVIFRSAWAPRLLARRVKLGV